MIVVLCALLALFCTLHILYLLGNAGYLPPNECKIVLREYREMLVKACNENHFEKKGYETTKRCVNDEIATYDPKECM